MILARATDEKGIERCEWCGAINHEPHPKTGNKVTLTIAHLEDPNPHNCDPKNLAALCNKCHNWYDAPMRAKNRIRNKLQKQLTAGQLPLF
jgi:5-methylcytosine-specific restriction endonuclease McrA